MSSPLLSYADLSIAFRRRGEWRTAVRGVDLIVRAGETVGLVGESGCGKSTLAMAGLGYLPDNARLLSGQVSLRGEPIASMSATALRQRRGETIAAVYQNPAAALNPSLSIGRQISEIFEHQKAMTPRAAMKAAHGMLETSAHCQPQSIAGGLSLSNLWWHAAACGDRDGVGW